MPLRRLFLLLLLISAGCGRRHEPRTELLLSTTTLTFSAPACGENPPTQKIGISVSGRAVPWSATTGFPWIQLSPQTGNVGSMTEEISVTINAGLLECGKTHSGAILIEASGAENSPQGIGVSVEIPTTPPPTPPPPPPPPPDGSRSLSVSPATIAFTAPCKGTVSSPESATIDISLSGGGSWSISGIPPWLAISSTSGTGDLAVTVSTILTGDAADCSKSFAVDLQVASEGAEGSPATVRVALTISGPASPVALSPAGAFGFFAASCKGATVAPSTPNGDTFTLTNQGENPVTWGVTSALPPWLSLDPPLGTISKDQRQVVTLVLAPSSIACNTQQAVIVEIADTGVGGNPLIGSLTVGLNVPSGWVFVNPKPTGNDLADIQFLDADRGWAVGTAGTILRTTDGGASWKQTASGTKNSLNAVRFASDGITGWIAATASPSDPKVLLKTIDGGASWQSATVALPSGWSGIDAFAGLFLNSATDGWAVGRGLDNSGRQPAIARTVDGETWSIQTTFLGLDADQRYEVNSISPRPGTSEVWAAGCRGTPGSCNFGVIFKQSGAGAWALQEPIAPGSWTLPFELDSFCSATVNDLPPFVRIAFAASTDGWIVASDPGGFSGSARGLNGAILHFNGAAWSVETDPGDPCAGSVRLGEIPIRSVASSGSATWFGGGSGLPAPNGAILSLWRFDGGSTWTDQTPSALLPTDQDQLGFPVTRLGLAGIAFKPGSPAAVSVGDKGLLLATTDASSAGWNEFDGPHVRSNLNGLAFNGSGTGIAVGNIFPCANPVTPGGCEPVIMRTTDGLTWGRLADVPPANQVMNAISFADASNALAVGQNGKVMKSIDGGASWTDEGQAGAATNLKSVVMKGAALAWAVGCDSTCQSSPGTGKILKYTGTWATTLASTPELYGLSFIDSTTGWAAGKGGAIFKTSGGGDAWISDNIGIPTTAALRAIQMLSATEGTVVGDSAFIARYTGGRWSRESAPFAGPTRLLGVFMIDSAKGWAVGTSGAVARRNGPPTWDADDSGTSLTLRSVFFSDPFNGWAVGDSGTILQTTSGGNLP